MITGFNTDIQFGGVTYHVQTEDKGLETPLILSLVYVGGAIIASKRSRYEDLIESGFDEQALTERLQRQHKLICAAIKQGRVDDLKKMAEPPKREAAPAQQETPKQEEPPKPKAQPTPAERPPTEKQAEPDKPPRREAARRAEPPARPTEAPTEEARPEPRPAPPETKREAAPAPEAPPARDSAPVRSDAPAGAAHANNETPVLLTGEDQYLDELFQRGATGALASEQSVEAERTPGPQTAPLPSQPPVTPPPPAPTPQPLNQPPPAPSFQSPAPPMLIPPDAVRVIEETSPAAFVGAAEEIYLTLLDDEGEFRAGQLATIKIRVGRGQFGQRPVADAAVTIKVLGTTFRPLILSTRTGADGVAVVRALLPRFTSGRAAIIIRASSGEEFAEMRRIIHQA